MNTLAAAIIALAMTFLGRPYVWGGETLVMGFDCSGLVKWLLTENGIPFPKWARMQWEEGVFVELDEAQPGDLVFFENTYPVDCTPPHISHVGIYLGEGKFINANSAKGVAIDDLRDPYWQGHFHSVKRVINEVGG